MYIYNAGNDSYNYRLPKLTYRMELRRWLNNDPTAFDWSSHFDHVVMKLEEKDKNEARAREVRLREAVKDVAFCDTI